MCIRIAVVDDLPDPAIWDPDEVTILVAGDTHHHDLIREVHALLTDLGAPTTGAGLTCFCGDPVSLPANLLPQPAGATPL
ncbi:hypothetical protein J3A78_003823 [Streptomyces sp. PvR006]|uniref:hypothetical protein n=1 Tax=Streptomyces sp. PvR006 TaxID=2817860 RepID=UPI001AE72440|nr:hypothetical protein [Streptomyces sp. PvR006]MBP2583345.1 hypothetical protein [Streptomyces sp. PvR006]